MRLRTLRALAALVLALLALAGYVALVTRAMDTVSYNTWGAMLMVPVVLALNLVLLAVVSQSEPDPTVNSLMALGLFLKQGGVLARYLSVYVLYGGAGDAQRYNLYAAEQYFNWRRGIFLWEETDTPSGTRNLELITTAIYTVIGPSTLTAFVVFGSFAFWGVFLLYRAFRLGVPTGDHRRYAALVFLLPSLLYWPSSIGKEAWLLLFVGVVAYGAASYFSGRVVSGLIVVGGGLVGTAIIRPHITVLLAVALLVAQLVKPARRSSTGILTKAVGVVVMGVALAVVATQSAQFLGIDDLSLGALEQQVQYRSGNTAVGGSAFEPVPLDSPLGLLAAIGTVMFRPLPWEASGVPMLVQSLEAVLLIILFVSSIGRLRSIPAMLPRHPYLVFSLVYALAFIVAFAGVANFGILARQRVLMLPLVLVLLALPVAGRRTSSGGRPYREAAARVDAW